jgi:uroporphyrin-III C-methyltransferase/precorrin-2 dehydrogenase/sirohydrochlorin ferrochelatase
MRHYPVFLDLRGRSIVVSGAGEVAVAKLRLLLKTEARIEVYGAEPVDEVVGWAREGRLWLSPRPLEAADAAGAALRYGANGNAEADARAAAIGRAAGALGNIVDNREDSDFITPAIVDRDPVTVATCRSRWRRPARSGCAASVAATRPRTACAGRTTWRDC